MRIIRFLGNVALWFGALLGIVAGGVWVADQLGWVQPLIVISGSMEPEIGTGDLLISRNLATGEVEVGDVISLHSEMTDKLVTHRVTEVDANDDGTWTISMKGDANDEPDLEIYTVGDSVLTPALQIPQGGKVVSKLMEPAVALPILLSLVALLGISLLDEPARPKAGRGRKRAEAALPDDDARDDISDDVSDDVDSELTAAMAVQPDRPDPIEDLDAALASVGAVVGADIDAPVAAPVDAPVDIVGASVHDLEAPLDEIDVSVDDLDVRMENVGVSVDDLRDLDDVDEPHDVDASVDTAGDDIVDLDAALAALGIDVGRLPAVTSPQATTTDAGLDPNADDRPSGHGHDPERRTDERDLVMSG